MESNEESTSFESSSQPDSTDEDAECEELRLKTQMLNNENHLLCGDLRMLSERCMKLASENECLMEQLRQREEENHRSLKRKRRNQLYGSEEIPKLEDDNHCPLKQELPSQMGGSAARPALKNNHAGIPSGGGESSSKKRWCRTIFTQEQKDKMQEFAERMGWRITKDDEAVVQEFVNETGVKQEALKNWMHNMTTRNKHLVKKP